MDLRIKPRQSLRAMNAYEVWAQRATVWGALARLLWLNLSQRAWSCLRTLTFRCTSQPRQGVQQLAWSEDLVVLVRRGLYQSTMTTVMLYNNHQISAHTTVSIYLTCVWKSAVGWFWLGWFGSAPFVSHPPSRTSRLVRECSSHGDKGIQE